MASKNLSYRKLSQEEIKAAEHTNLIEFLQSINEPVKKMGNSYKWTGAGNDSVKIIPHNPHLYKHFATGESGNAITFCTKKLGMTFQEAVESLTRGRFINAFPDKNGAMDLYNAISKANSIKTNIGIQNGTIKPFTLPKKDIDNNKLIKYLSEERKIHPLLIDYFISKGLIYQTKEKTDKGREYSNIAFVGYDLNKNAKSVIKRGFPYSVKDKDGNKDFYSGFKGNHEGSDITNYGFLSQKEISNNPLSSSLFAFEAPIDLLSYMTNIVNTHSIEKALSHTYLATGGGHISSLSNLLKNNSDYDTIYLCFDNDRVGIDARLSAIHAIEKLKEERILSSDTKIISHLPKNKDWNEDLVNNIKSPDLIKGCADEMVKQLCAKQKELIEAKKGFVKQLDNPEPILPNSRKIIQQQKRGNL